jgi:hypothetical protein
MKPSFSTPIAIRIAPDNNAKAVAAAMMAIGSLKPSFAMAAAVIKDTIATGPTDNVRLDPNSA